MEIASTKVQDLLLHFGVASGNQNMASWKILSDDFPSELNLHVQEISALGRPGRRARAATATMSRRPPSMFEDILDGLLHIQGLCPSQRAFEIFECFLLGARSSMDLLNVMN